ncbi:hypothetical protein D3C72_1721890 [compost metagenome]
MVETGDQAQERGLAAAAGAEQGDEFAGGDVEVDVVQDLQLVFGRTEPVADIPDVDTCAR